MMKGITPIIAIIVLLLITVALAGAAWSYLQSYMGGLTSKSIEVRDYFCITSAGGQMPVLVVANIGTEPINTADVMVLNATSGSAPDGGGTWRPMSGGTGTTTQIAPNTAARWESTAACSGTCSFRVTVAGGRTQRVSVTC